MEEMKTFNSQNMQIDQGKLKRITIKINNLERENTKTNRLTDKQIRNEIRNIIESEVPKCY